MNRISLALAIALSTLLVGCGQPSFDHDAEAEALIDLSRQWSAMIEAGDYEGGMQFWADDAVMLPPDLPILDGKAAIREYVEATKNIPGFRITWEPLEAHISDNADMAYLIERNVIEVDGSDGEKIVTHGKVVTIWRRDEDGQWRNVVDMWNTAPPPE